MGVLAIGNGASSKVGSFKATKRGQTNGIGWIAATPDTVGVPIGHEEPIQKIGVGRFPTERVDIGDPLNGQKTNSMRHCARRLPNGVAKTIASQPVV